MREGGKRGATPSPSFEATHQRRAVPGRSPDSQVTASQTAFPSLRKQQWPIAVLKHSLLTVARPCGNCTRFPFHSHDCREHLALTAADASKWESPGQFSEGETARAVRRVFGEAVRVPLIVIYGAGCLPPTGSTAGSALSPTPPQGGSDTGTPYAGRKITPPLRGSRRSRADRRRLMRWGGPAGRRENT